MGFDKLENWYLQGTTLHPTPHHLRRHVTALSENEASTSLTLTFTDSETLTLSHTQLSISPLRHLTPFTALKLSTSSESFHKIRDFIYCAPVDLSETPLSLINAARAWGLSDLFQACFLVAESAGFDVVQILERYIPLISFEHTPERFMAFVCARVAVDAKSVMEWVKEGVGKGNRMRLVEMIERCGMKQRLQQAMLHHSEMTDVDVIGCDTRSVEKCDTKGLFWVVELGELLRSQREYYEGEIMTKGACASVEVTWGREGAGLIIGLQRLEGCGLVDVSACAIGLSCVCGDPRHNQGWMVEGGVRKRNVDWLLTHEIAFALFDGKALRDWRETHENCAIRVKIRIVVGDEDGSTGSSSCEGEDNDI